MNKHYDTRQPVNVKDAILASQVLDTEASVRGVVQCLVEEIDPKTGRTLRTIVHHKRNLVVNLGKENLCFLLAAPQTTRHITSFKLGTKGNVTGDNLTPVEPEDTDRDLKDTVTAFQKDFTAYAMYPTDNTKTEIQFSCILEPGEANAADTSVNQGAIAYTEAGMYTKAGVLFARETFPAVVKTINRRITFTWSILF